MFSSVNFRAILDHFQAIVTVFGKPQNLPVDARPFQYRFPPNSTVNTTGAMSNIWRKELQAYEDAKKSQKLKNSVSGELQWSEKESLAARMERARQLITLTNNAELMVLLGDIDIITLLSEKQSLVRMRGNVEAHKIVEQGMILEEMVHQCAAQLESFEVSGLLAMIKLIRPATESSNTA